MANVYWIGGATNIAQVDTLTVGGTVEADDIFIITVYGENNNSFALSVVAGSTNVDTVATTIAAAWNASVHHLLTPITAAGVGSGGNLTLTADIEGTPFYVVATTTEDGGGAADDQTFDDASTTPNSGEFDYNTAANWLNEGSEGDLPGANASDKVYVKSATVKYGLNQADPNGHAQSNQSNRYDELHISNSVVGENPDSGFEPGYLKVVSTLTKINETDHPSTKTNSGPVLLYLTDPDTLLAVQPDLFIYGSGVNSIATNPSILINSDADDGGGGDYLNMVIYGGEVGLAFFDGDLSTIEDIASYGGSLWVGEGVTWSTSSIRQYGGSIDISDTQSSITNVYIENGSMVSRETLLAVDIRGGVLTQYGVLTVVNITGGVIDHFPPDDQATQTVSTINAYGGVYNGRCPATYTNINQFRASLVDLTLSQHVKVVSNNFINFGKLRYIPVHTTISNQSIPQSSSDERSVEIDIKEVA